MRNDTWNLVDEGETAVNVIKNLYLASRLAWYLHVSEELEHSMGRESEINRFSLRNQVKLLQTHCRYVSIGY